MTEKVTEKDKNALTVVEKVAIIVAVQHALSTALAGAVAELVVTHSEGATDDDTRDCGLFEDGRLEELTSGISAAFSKAGIDIDALADLIG